MGTWIDSAHPFSVDDHSHLVITLEDQLVKVGQGDVAAFEDVYDAIGPTVYGVVRRVLRDLAQSEEVTQEVMLEVWRRAPRFDQRLGSGLAWVATIAHRRAVDRVRSEQKASTREQGVAMPPGDYDEVAESVDRSLDHERVRRCLSSLTELQRESVVLAYFGGHTCAEVATLLDVPVGTMKTRLRDGLVRLRDCMGVTR